MLRTINIVFLYVIGGFIGTLTSFYTEAQTLSSKMQAADMQTGESALSAQQYSSDILYYIIILAGIAVLMFGIWKLLKK